VVCLFSDLIAKKTAGSKALDDLAETDGGGWFHWKL
jgi:hypothetical protein